MKIKRRLRREGIPVPPNATTAELVKLMDLWKHWRMLDPCADCPFSDSEQGKLLAQSLEPGRVASIKRDLLRGRTFMCHKTTRETGDGSNKLCAGALAWQNGEGVVSQYQQVCERVNGFEAMKSRGEKVR